MWTFHTAISHKLRTPLVSYLGGLNLLYDNIEHMDRTMARNIAAIALSAAKRLQQVIDDIFLYVRSPGDIHYDNCTVFDLPAMVSTLNQELEIPAISLSIDPVLDARRLRISRRSLEMVLRELCENARKFHPQQRPMVTIRVDADLAQNQVRLVVCDDGVHLPPAHLQKIWQPYYQAERNFTGQVEGMGLGLAQVARIILAVGGSYQMRNRSDRPGICVELRIPFVEEDSSDRVIG
jgi:signal transduction histidine kinase